MAAEVGVAVCMLVELVVEVDIAALECMVEVWIVVKASVLNLHLRRILYKILHRLATPFHNMGNISFLLSSF